MEYEYRRLAEEKAILGRVDWAGRLPFRDFMTVIAKCDLALYPSRTALNGDSEGGAPVTLIEAQWLGVPSIVSDHADLSFVAGPSAPVLDATDVDAWAETMREHYRNPLAVKAQSVAARAFARAHHAPETNVRAREEVYLGL